MLDWWAARMMAWAGDLAAAGWEIIDSFPSEQFPAYDHLVAVNAKAPSWNGPLTAALSDSIPLGNVPILDKWTSAYADGCPQEVLFNLAANEIDVMMRSEATDA